MKLFFAKCLSIFHIIIVSLPFLLRLYYINNNKYDIYLLIFILFLRIHWFFFKGECILSYFEKKIALSNYNMGDDIYCIPYIELFNSHHINYTKNIITYDTFKYYHIQFFLLIILFLNRNDAQFKILLLLSFIILLVNNYFNKLFCKHIDNRKKQKKNFISDIIVYN